MTALVFPSSPSAGDFFDGPNNVKYQFDGVKWIGAMNQPPDAAQATRGLVNLTAGQVLGDGAKVIDALRTRAITNVTSFDLAQAEFFSRTVASATTFAVTNVPAAGISTTFILDLTNGGSQTLTWWANLKWEGGVQPTLTTAGRDVLGFFTYDGGATWTGLLLAKDVK